VVVAVVVVGFVVKENKSSSSKLGKFDVVGLAKGEVVFVVAVVVVVLVVVGLGCGVNENKSSSSKLGNAVFVVAGFIGGRSFFLF
jgi:hypothetical protein